jgi:predicted porin
VKVPASAGGQNGVNFDIKRFYVGIDHTFNKTFAANITTDFTYDAATGATQIYIKKAYLQAKLSNALILRFGSADLPWIPFVEDVYGYRYVENTLIDRTKFGTSADWGVHALGSLPVNKDLVISYDVAAINGAGYKSPGIGTANRSKGIDLEGRVSATAMKHFTVAVGGYTGKLGKDKEGVVTYNTANRFDALAAYTDDRIRVGVEYFHASDWNDVLQANPALTNSSDGFSVFGSYKFTPQVGVFGRYDWVKPKQDSASALKDNYFNVGVSYSPAKIVDFALVYKRDKVDNGLIGTSNGNIGGSTDGTYDEFGLWGQFRW